MGPFLAMAITSVSDNFLVICFHILKGLAIYYLACKFHMGSRELFFHKLAMKSKTQRFMRENPLSPSCKTPLYYETYDTSQKAISWPIFFIFLLGACHLNLISFSIKSFLCIIFEAWHNFFTEKTDRKNVATLRTCCTETKSCKKLKKVLPMLRKCRKWRLLAHLEPKILKLFTFRRRLNILLAPTVCATSVGK